MTLDKKDKQERAEECFYVYTFVLFSKKKLLLLLLY